MTEKKVFILALLQALAAILFFIFLIVLIIFGTKDDSIRKQVYEEFESKSYQLCIEKGGIPMVKRYGTLDDCIL